MTFETAAQHDGNVRRLFLVDKMSMRRNYSDSTVVERCELDIQLREFVYN